MTRIPPVALGALSLALALKLALAASTFGTTDVRAFLYFALKLEATGAASVYELKDFNHPPSMLLALGLVHRLAGASDAAFAFWMRLPAILADVGSFLVVAAWLRPHARASALVLLALAPASILVSGFHGNTDPVMMFLVLLSVALLERSRPVALAGAALGLALSVKVVPLVLLPAIVLWIPGWRQRLLYLGAALLVVAATWTPIGLAVPPELLARRVLGYGSHQGIWGVTRILPLASAHGRVLVAAAVVALSFWMNLRERRPALFLQVGAVLFLFLALAPGFGVQYLSWLVPFAVLLPLLASLAFHAASGAFLVAVYTFWCQVPPGVDPDPDWLGANFWSRGLPWNIANAHRTGHWRGEIVALEVLCWIAVLAGAAILARAALRGTAGGRFPGSA